MVEPIARSSDPPIAYWPMLSWHHPCDRLAEGADEGVLFILLFGGDINLFSDLIDFFMIDRHEIDLVALPMERDRATSCCCLRGGFVDGRVEYPKLGKVNPPQHSGSIEHPRMLSTCESSSR